jgi:CheY-like chemotaxis protein
VLLDIGMPGLNGLDLAQRIRRTDWGHDALLIAATGWGQQDDRERSRDAGFDHHLTKPIDTQTLQKLLAEVSRRPRRPDGAPTDAPGAAGPPGPAG